ncbi:MAG: AI-2E family transporter [Bacillota bacterium]|nr:AI-2E family transporter [Bacillota bacterium]
MKFIDEEMKKKIIVYSSSLVIAIIVAMLLFNLDIAISVLKKFIGASYPFIIGLFIAFVLNGPVELFEKTIFKKFPRKKILSVLLAFTLLIGLIFITFGTVIPSLVDSIRTFIDNIAIYQNSLIRFLNSTLNRMDIYWPELEKVLSTSNVLNTISSFIRNSLPKLLDYSYSFMKSAINILLALVAAIYMLIDKKNLLNTFKSLNYALFSEDLASRFENVLHDAKIIFEQFIVGSVIDSSIIGLLTYVACLIFRIPYAPMIGFIVGITNVIPMFGPFLGAIPVVIILLLIQPVSALLFAILILIIQQIDGNLVKPIILGDRLGISGFWILFSVSIGGTLYGVLGMFFGVPVFAFIYSLLVNFTTIQLQNKNVNINQVRKRQDLKWAKKIKDRLGNHEEEGAVTSK